MANQAHVDLLKQGVGQWNEWREQYPGTQPDLNRADLSTTNLRYANLRSTNLRYANLRHADLRYADFSDSDLSAACLIHTNLIHANLGYTNLNDADLRNADLSDTNLSGAGLHGIKLQGAIIWETVFSYVDLQKVKGLTEIRYKGPSCVELHTIQLPQDGSALHFLRSTGVPEEWIDLYRTQMMHPIQYHSLFISYASKDETVASRLHADLQDHGVRCWFAPEDLKIGERFHSRINEAIHLQDKLLLLLSENAIQSAWVEIEVRAALEKEQRQHRDVLFPVRLDNSVMETSQAWAAMLRQSRHIGDFTNWADPQAYQQAFERLLQDLKKTDERQDQETKL